MKRYFGIIILLILSGFFIGSFFSDVGELPGEEYCNKTHTFLEMVAASSIMLAIIWVSFAIGYKFKEDES